MCVEIITKGGDGLKRLLALSLVALCLVGCTGGIGGGTPLNPGGGSDEPEIIELSIGSFEVEEYRSGYGNVPGMGTHFEYSYAIDLEVVNAGNVDTQYEVRVYGKQVNVINPPWIRLLVYGPADISKGGIQSLELYKATGEAGVGRWKVEVYAMIGEKMTLADTKETDRM